MLVFCEHACLCVHIICARCRYVILCVSTCVRVFTCTYPVFSKCLCLQKQMQTKSIAQSFCPEYSHQFDLSLPLTPDHHRGGSFVQELLEGRQCVALFEVYHKVLKSPVKVDSLHPHVHTVSSFMCRVCTMLYVYGAVVCTGYSRLLVLHTACDCCLYFVLHRQQQAGMSQHVISEYHLKRCCLVLLSWTSISSSAESQVPHAWIVCWYSVPTNTVMRVSHQVLGVGSPCVCLLHQMLGGERQEGWRSLFSFPLSTTGILWCRRCVMVGKWVGLSPHCSFPPQALQQGFSPPCAPWNKMAAAKLCLTIGQVGIGEECITYAASSIARKLCYLRYKVYDKSEHCPPDCEVSVCIVFVLFARPCHDQSGQGSHCTQRNGKL